MGVLGKTNIAHMEKIALTPNLDLGRSLPVEPVRN
jgi:hypothetical protein